MSFFEIKPKVFIILIIYVTLFYMTTTIFSYSYLRTTQYENVNIGYTGVPTNVYETQIPYENMTEEQQSEAQTEATKKGALEGGILGFLVGGGIVVGSFLLGCVTGGAGWVGIPWGVTIMASSASIGAVGGMLYENAKLEGLIEPLPIEVIFDLIIYTFDTVLNLIHTFASFITFGFVENQVVPSIPYPFNLISFLCVFPVVVVITIWVVGVVIQGVEAIRG